MERGKQQAYMLWIQETHFQTSKTPHCSHREYPHIFLASTPRQKRGGVLMALRSLLSFLLKQTFVDEGGRYIIITGDINSQPYTLVTAYTPNSHQIRFICKLLKRISTMRYGNLIICGDFNLTVNTKLDITIKKPTHTTILRHLLHTEELYDSWRCLHANEKGLHLLFP